jgi:hypothetical protein
MEINMDIYSSKGILLAKSDVVISEPVFDEGMITEEGIPVDAMGTEVKDPILSSWPFVIGISTAVLAVSVALGVLLAKRKIKKGIELYED